MFLFAIFAMETFLSFLSILVVCSSSPLNYKDELFVLSIIHFSDFHARFDQVSPTAGLCYEQVKDKCVGGISRVATIVERLRKIRPNPILLNAGDFFQGTIYYDLFKGNITAHFMNKLDFDAYTIGNHDFDDNISGFVSFVKQLKSPMVATNIDYSEEPSMQHLYTNSTVIRREDKVIGVIGVITSATHKTSKTTGNLEFLNEVETVNLEAKKLKARGIDMIIVLSHCGIEHDKVIASSCPDVDVIVGGHSHKLLYNGKPPSNDIAYGEYPIVVTQEESNRKVLIVHAGAFTKYMGDLEVIFDTAGEVVSWKGNPIYLDQSIPEDSSFLKELEPWKTEVDRFAKRILATSSVFLNASCSTGECTLANLITDAMVYTYRKQASISLLPAFYMKNSIPEGSIRYEDIYAMLPMIKPTWHLIELKGSDLLQILEDNVDVASNDTTFRNPELIHWSGLKVVYNLRNEKSKVVRVKVKCLSCEDGRFEVLNNEEWYRVVIPANMLSNTYKTLLLKHRLIKSGKQRDIDYFLEYFEKKKVINVMIESRIIFV